MKKISSFCFGLIAMQVSLNSQVNVNNNGEVTQPLISRETTLKAYPGSGEWAYADLPGFLPAMRSVYGWKKVDLFIDGLYQQHYPVISNGKSGIFILFSPVVLRKIGKKTNDNIFIDIYPDKTNFRFTDSFLDSLTKDPASKSVLAVQSLSRPISQPSATPGDKQAFLAWLSEHNKISEAVSQYMKVLSGNDQDLERDQNDNGSMRVEIRRSILVPEFHPQRTNGDNDFSTHGPKTMLSGMLTLQNNNVIATVSMKCEETEKDWTSAYGTTSIIVFTAPVGWVVSGWGGWPDPELTNWTRTYTDHSPLPDTIMIPWGRLVCIGQTAEEDLYDEAIRKPLFVKGNEKNFNAYRRHRTGIIKADPGYQVSIIITRSQ